MIICPNCGKENADNANHCGFCGHQLGEVAGSKKTMFGMAGVSADQIRQAAEEAKRARESGSQPARSSQPTPRLNIPKIGGPPAQSDVEANAPTAAMDAISADGPTAPHQLGPLGGASGGASLPQPPSSAGGAAGDDLMAELEAMDQQFGYGDYSDDAPMGANDPFGAGPAHDFGATPAADPFGAQPASTPSPQDFGAPSSAPSSSDPFGAPPPQPASSGPSPYGGGPTDFGAQPSSSAPGPFGSPQAGPAGNSALAKPPKSGLQLDDDQKKIVMIVGIVFGVLFMLSAFSCILSFVFF